MDWVRQRILVVAACILSVHICPEHTISAKINVNSNEIWHLRLNRFEQQVADGADGAADFNRCDLILTDFHLFQCHSDAVRLH